MNDCRAVGSNTGMTICKVPKNEVLQFDQAMLVALFKKPSIDPLVQSDRRFTTLCSPARFLNPKGSGHLYNIVFILLHRANQNLSTSTETSACLRDK